MKNARWTLVLLLLFCFPLPSLWAWGKLGHRVVAEVAYRHLSHRAQRRVDATLGSHGMVYLASWPDEIKSDTIYPNSFDWHYQDLPPQLSDEAVCQTLTDYPSHGGNLWRATDSIDALLRRDWQRDACVFLVHLMADRFCPMHLAHEDDLGGNRVPMLWFGTKTNLHRVWDEHLPEARGFSYTEYADYLERRFGAEEKAILKMSEEEIVLHNYRLTQAVYAYQEAGDTNTYHYIYRWGESCDRLLYMAGIRLAQRLNQLCR